LPRSLAICIFIFR